MLWVLLCTWYTYILYINACDINSIKQYSINNTKYKSKIQMFSTFLFNSTDEKPTSLHFTHYIVQAINIFSHSKNLKRSLNLIRATSYSCQKISLAPSFLSLTHSSIFDGEEQPHKNIFHYSHSPSDRVPVDSSLSLSKLRQVC